MTLQKQLVKALETSRGFKRQLLETFWWDGEGFSHEPNTIVDMLTYRDMIYQQELNEAIARLEVEALKG